MSRHVELHAEIKIKGQWHHLLVKRIENLEVMMWLNQVENRPRLTWPLDMSIITRMSLDMRSVDAHSKCCADDLEIMWLSEYMPKGLCEQEIGYFFNKPWWSWFREPMAWQEHKRQGVEDFRWIWWSIG